MAPMSQAHSGIPLWNTAAFGLWDVQTAQKPWHGPCKFDGTSEDYWTYLRRAETICSPFAGPTKTRVGKTASIHIPTQLFQPVFVRYWLRAAKTSEFHLLPQDVATAIHGTRLTWIDAEAFAALPDAMGIMLEAPGPEFQLYSHGPTGDWHDVRDLLLLKIKDPDTRARVLDNLKLDPEDESSQLFTWIAGAREQGSGALNWGVFHVSKNMKLTHLAEGLDDLLDRLQHQAERYEFTVAPEEVGPRPTARDFIRKLNQIGKDSQRDFTEGHDEQRRSLASCMNFLAKFVLISNCEWFKPGLEQVLPTGLRARPHQARKLWALYGKRFRVHLPPPDQTEVAEDAPQEAAEGPAGHRKSPVRHFVPGFLRSQPYGPGRSLRKIIWVLPFWRGKIQVGAPVGAC